MVLLAVILLACLGCMGLSYGLWRAVLRAGRPGHPMAMALIASLLVSGLLLWLFRDRAPPNLPVNGLTEALYIACLLNIPAAILLTWRR